MEFLKDLEEFKDWLFNLTVASPEEATLLNKIKYKWEELDLNRAV